MNNEEISRYSKRFVRYFWDPIPKNEDSTPVWCLGRVYKSHPAISADEVGTTRDGAVSISSESSSSAADSAVATSSEHQQKQGDDVQVTTKEGRSEPTERDEALDKGWPAAFIDDIESKIWMTYRSNFTSIAKSADPKATRALSWSTRFKQMSSQDGFTSDAGFGCMIRSGQSLLANALIISQLGRDWRTGQQQQAERDLLSLFADDPSAPFSIHRFVSHGAAACGKHPGEWFGPSATARCIQVLTEAHQPNDLRVYVRPDDSDVYEDTFLRTARGDDGVFEPTLVLLGTRLGIDRVTPVYHAALKKALEMPQSIGIAGGRPSSSHYFIGTQGQSFFYLDPHHTRPALPVNPSADDVATCHTRRLRRLDVAEMDPSMLLAFLIRSEQDWTDWRAAITQQPEASESGGARSKQIVHIHDKEPQYTAGRSSDAQQGERREAVDEVQSCDESDDDTVVC